MEGTIRNLLDSKIRMQKKGKYMKTEIEKNLVSKLLCKLKDCPEFMKNDDRNYILGMTDSQIQNIKKFALENNLIEEFAKSNFCLTKQAEQFIKKYPYCTWTSNDYPKRPDVNFEYLKLEKCPAALTRSIKSICRILLNEEELKPDSVEESIIREILSESSSFKAINSEIADIILDKKERITIFEIINKFQKKPYGLTPSIIRILLCDFLISQKNKIAFFENNQFILKTDSVLFERMFAVPEKFEVQYVEPIDMPIIAEISKLILPFETSNILDVTKGLLYLIKNLDKFTLHTENINAKTIKFRNAILNAKDPVKLFYVDIPKIFCSRILCQCDNELTQCISDSIEELQNCYDKLINHLLRYVLKEFKAKNRKELTVRFSHLKDYFSNPAFRVILEFLEDNNNTDKRFIEKFATFLNKSRVPKDWCDMDVADFKLKVKDIAYRFNLIESSAGTIQKKPDTKVKELINEIKKLNQIQQNALLRQVANL
nr:MAG TPA: hypothetical protein [Caudoviricetes sp.]